MWAEATACAHSAETIECGLSAAIVELFGLRWQRHVQGRRTNQLLHRCKRFQKFTSSGGLFTNACRTYDTTSSLRPVTQLRYDLFTNMVAKRYRIARTIRLFAGRISTNCLHFDFSCIRRGRNKYSYVFSKYGKVRSKICLNSSNVYLNEKKCL